MRPLELRAYCDSAFRKYHHPEYISPDPLEVVTGYESIADREIAGFIAAALALGRVGGIVKSARWVLDRLQSPATFLRDAGDRELGEITAPFRYRFFDGDQLAGLLAGLRSVLREYGSIQECFAHGLPPDRSDVADGIHGPGSDRPCGDVVIGGLSYLVSALVAGSSGALEDSILVARPERGSACKRLLLFLRWMVREDRVDPGGWTVVTPAHLLVPVDTHMLSVCRSLGLTRSRQASLAVAREVTAAFAQFVPEDPVKYDFSLTRMGIHPAAIREAKSAM